MGTRTADEARATTGTEATDETEAKRETEVRNRAQQQTEQPAAAGRATAPDRTNEANEANEANGANEANDGSDAGQAESGVTAAAGAAGDDRDREAGEPWEAGESAAESRTATGEAGHADPGAGAEEAEAGAEEAGAQAAEAGKAAPSGVGQGAGAVVSAALGLVSLSGSWLGTVAGAREQLTGQLRTSTSASVATQIKEVYGDTWHTTALWGGLFALLALIVGAAVLARPAFGAPGRSQAPWTRSVAWAGVALGAVGLLLAVLKYTDVLLGLPSA
nr:hypothetical protein StreXyl84_19420 [Streptomyces sp. Xyl84]